MWHTQSASVAGRGHQRRGVCCQDRSYSLQRAGVTALALADGAGSSLISQEGAACVTRTVCELLCREFDAIRMCRTPREAKGAILYWLLERVRERAAELEADVPALACTLMAVAVRGDDYLILHLGDGVIGYRKGGKMLVASAPQNGEFANRTVFVTSPDAVSHMRILRGSQPELDGFLLMTDGCEASLYHKQNCRIAPVASNVLLRTELLTPETSEHLLHELLTEVIMLRTTDDCSLATLCRSRDRAPLWQDLTQRQKASLLAIGTQKRSRRRRIINRYERRFKKFRLNPEKSSPRADK